ncbi:MAG: helix-turn-helix domain-containing protein, partial [Kosmotogaceae bacterium]
MEHFKAFKKVDEIFELFFEQSKWRLSDVVDRLGYPKATVHHILAAMTELDYLT